MSGGEVIDLTRDDAAADAAAARRAAKRARRSRAAAAASADVIDLSRDEDPAAAAGGSRHASSVRVPFSCAICMTDCAAEEGHALFCGHIYCRECLGAHCASQVGDGLPGAGVLCPEPSCRAPLTGADVAAVADRATAARFEALALEKLVQSNRDSMGCVPAAKPCFFCTRALTAAFAAAARRPGARFCSPGTQITASWSARCATRRTA